MSKKRKPPHWDGYLESDDDSNEWDERDDGRPVKLERRRHRDRDDADERRRAQHRRHHRSRHGRSGEEDTDD